MLSKKRNPSEETKSTKLTFLFKLFEILNSEEFQNIIHWGNEENSIEINDINNLSKIILPKYFKHNNFSSFVRMLNLYNFHKVKTDKSNCSFIFTHDIFRKNISFKEIKNIKKIEKNGDLCCNKKEENLINNNIILIELFNDLKEYKEKNNQLEKKVNLLTEEFIKINKELSLFKNKVKKLSKENLINRFGVICNNLIKKRVFKNIYYHQNNQNKISDQDLEKLSPTEVISTEESITNNHPFNFFHKKLDEIIFIQNFPEFNINNNYLF